jgi:hypothetical protein
MTRMRNLPVGQITPSPMALQTTAVDNNETFSPSYCVWERWSTLINKGNSVRLVRLDGKPIPKLRPQL